MSSTDLPHKDSPNLHLVPATTDEYTALQHLNSEDWRGPLSLEAYLRRELALFNQELTKDGGLTPWVLVYQTDPHSTRRVVSGCESQNRKALVARNGKVEDVVGHAIASVFCPPEFRGRGYGGRMMSEVAKKLRTWQAKAEKETLFSILFSDIGKEFYARLGWQPFPSAHVSLPASQTATPSHVRLLRDADLPELCAVDEQLLHKRLLQSAKAGRSAVALVPEYRSIRWHHAREDFVANEIKGRVPEVKGAMVGEHPGSRVWAYWTRVWTNPQEESPDTLHILRLVIEDEAYSEFSPASSDGIDAAKNSPVARATAAIMTVAQAQAAEWDMEEVTIWNPTSATVAAAQSIDASASVVHREAESISSLLWYGPGVWQDVDWICNEKYAWC